MITEEELLEFFGEDEPKEIARYMSIWINARGLAWKRIGHEANRLDEQLRRHSSQCVCSL